MLELSLKEQLTKLQREKNDLETRFKKSVKEILKMLPLPSQIPVEYSSLCPLFSLIYQVSSHQVQYMICSSHFYLCLA